MPSGPHSWYEGRPRSGSDLWPLGARTGLSLVLRVQSRPVLARPPSEGPGPCSGDRPAPAAALRLCHGAAGHPGAEEGFTISGEGRERC